MVVEVNEEDKVIILRYVFIKFIKMVSIGHFTISSLYFQFVQGVTLIL